MLPIKPYTRLSRREDMPDMCDKNSSVLTLDEVVKRWHESGQFLMQEVNHSDAYEGKSADLDDHAIIGRLSKLESYLMGIKEVNEVKAQAPAEPAPETSPAEPASVAE